MSDKELKISQKLFALLERLVKETKVHGIEVVPDPDTGRVAALDLGMTVNNCDLDFKISTGQRELSFHLDTEVIGIMQQFSNPTVHDGGMKEIDAQVKDEPVDNIHRPKVLAVAEEDIKIDTGVSVRDLFKTYNIKSKPTFTTKIHSLEAADWTTVSQDIPVKMTARIHDNLFFVRRLTVERQAVELSLMSEPEQLEFWKIAVIKTRKEPKQLKLLGVYTGIPYALVERDKITMNPGRGTLSYRLKMDVPRKRSSEDMKDIALFAVTNDSAKSTLLMVKK